VRARVPILVTLLAAVALGAVALAESGPALGRRVDDALDRTFLKPGWVNSSVGGHKVTLRGSVPDEMTRALVVLIAGNVPDVRRVADELTVDPALEKWRPTLHEQRLDALANARIALRTDPELLVYTTLRASLEGGKIVVRGAVAKQDHRVAIEARLLASEGVTKLENHVVVRDDAPRRSPPGAPTGEHAELEREVNQALRADVLLTSRARIDAHAWGGRILLQGTAEDRIARDYAVELARKQLRAHEEHRARRPGPFERLLRGAPEAPASEDRPIGSVVSNVLIRPARRAASE
jgi:osmotically-inducible protein OsmY